MVIDIVYKKTKSKKIKHTSRCNDKLNLYNISLFSIYVSIKKSKMSLIIHGYKSQNLNKK